MNLKLLRTEAERSEQAELESDDQLRKLTALVTKASASNTSINPSDCTTDGICCAGPTALPAAIVKWQAERHLAVAS